MIKACSYSPLEFYCEKCNRPFSFGGVTIEWSPCCCREEKIHLCIECALKLANELRESVYPYAQDKEVE